MFISITTLASISYLHSGRWVLQESELELEWESHVALTLLLIFVLWKVKLWRFSKIDSKQQDAAHPGSGRKRLKKAARK